MSDDPQLTTLRELAKTLPVPEVDGVTAAVDREGASVEASKGLGKGWRLTGTAKKAWDSGWQALAKLTWTPKPRP
jgi:hypothetical protein